MFDSVQKRRRPYAAMAIDIAPLIDVVFILLIFFLVTATFVRETGMEVQRPQAVRSAALEPASLRISITAAGLVYTEGRQVDLPELHQQVRQFLSKDSAGAVILIPDEQVPAGRLVAVMDVAKLAGARDIALATRPKGRP